MSIYRNKQSNQNVAGNIPRVAATRQPPPLRSNTPRPVHLFLRSQFYASRAIGTPAAPFSLPKENNHIVRYILIESGVALADFLRCI
jgi:hypothetical protein